MMIRLVLGLLYIVCLGTNSTAGDFINKAVEPHSWLEEASITTGMTVTLCTYQALRGALEGYHFSQEAKHLISSSDYHVWKTAGDIAGFSAGAMTWAQLTDSRRPWYIRGKKVLGAACWGRNVFEWSYKYQRYGNPFDYTEEHNKCALVYFTIRHGALVDMYISTGPATGPLVDLAFATVGTLLLR